MRDQCLPEHLARDLTRFFRRFAQVHAALETIRERPLPSPAGMNLRLHHESRPVPSSRAILFASSGVEATLPRGVATPNFCSNSLA